MMEQSSAAINTLVMYFGRTQFRSQLVGMLSEMKFFIVVLVSLRKCYGYLTNSLVQGLTREVDGCSVEQEISNFHNIQMSIIALAKAHLSDFRV
jgi:hypothetical protein